MYSCPGQGERFYLIVGLEQVLGDDSEGLHNVDGFW